MANRKKMNPPPDPSKPLGSETPAVGIGGQIARMLAEQQRERQKLEESVRTSFALSQDALGRIALLVERFGPPKKVFDSIINQNTIEMVLFGEVVLTEAPPPPLTRKSFVISRKALMNLNMMAGKKNIRRDTLVDIILTWAAEGVQMANAGMVERQTKAFRLIENFLPQAQDLEKRLREVAGWGDPLTSAFSSVVFDLEIMAEKAVETLSLGQPILFPIDLDREIGDVVDDQDRAAVEGTVKKEE